MITIRSGSSIFYHKTRNATNSVLGIVIKTSDITVKIIDYKKIQMLMRIIKFH